MPDSSKIKEFPDINKKLSAPTKKSQFEKQKEEAEAKRLREEQETAAAYADFVKSFEDDTGGGPTSGGGFGPSTGRDGGLGGFRGGPGPRRHFAQPSMPRLSGPGSLGPPPVLSKRRGFDDQPLVRDRDRDRPLQGSRGALGDSDDEDERVTAEQIAERAPPKPTLHLSSMPPGTSAAVVRSLIPSKLKVEGIRFLPSAPQNPTERPSASAIVALSSDTTSTDIDSAVSSLQKTYMGWGFYLSISRHVSTTHLGLEAVPAPAIHQPNTPQFPFGAKLVNPVPTGPMNRAPPPGSFAPPPSYGPSATTGSSGAPPPIQVQVTPPSDLNQLQLIHKTIEYLIRYGPEFEALLLSRPDVQKEEKWAWIWDPSSRGGIWYRWKLWSLNNQLQLDPSEPSFEEDRKRSKDPVQQIFEGEAPWVLTTPDLKFEFVNDFEDLVIDSDYESEDEESDDEETRRRKQVEQTTLGEADGPSYLDPMGKARFLHLLARLPKTTAALRKGDIARITAFAIKNASSGFEEIVDMVVSHILRPYNWTSASESKPKNHSEEPEKKSESEDPSHSKLIGLYIISDILNSSGTAGVRHAWRYRTAFENALKERKVFEHLGRLDRDLGWGRMRTDRWRNSVEMVLRRWRDVNLFMDETHNYLAHAFANPPLTEAEKEADAASKAKEKEKAAAEQAELPPATSEANPEADGSGDAPSTKAASEEHEANVPGSNPTVARPEIQKEDAPMEDVQDARPQNDEAKKDELQKGDHQAKPMAGFSMSVGSASGQADAKGPRRRPRAEDLFE